MPPLLKLPPRGDPRPEHTFAGWKQLTEFGIGDLMHSELRNELEMARERDGRLHSERERDPLFHVPIVEHRVCRSAPVTWSDIDESAEAGSVRQSAHAPKRDNLDPMLPPEMVAEKKRI